MKVIFLNCCYGLKFKELAKFLKECSKEVDVFCLQETEPNLNKKIADELPNYEQYYTDVKTKLKSIPKYGQTILLNKDKDLSVTSYNIVEIFKNRFPNYGFMQTISLFKGSKKYLIANLHGRSQPGHKMDTLARLNQSKNIINTLSSYTSYDIVLGGDFNLDPKTKSIKKIVDAGFRDLVKEYSIKTTRNKLAWSISKKRYAKHAKYYGKQLFADYCFISDKTSVNSFEVPNILVSDHLPLIIDLN